ncbi:nucleoside ABC transporter membrane protein [Arthrobacter sp. yr096]|uniref:ABC transporter permease n=1 Tax=unclassified Arthrobacter TaxID=235627 RepID=UPI000897AA3C|nr:MULTISPECIES: ABC transporter permease [unclassified Arthrobacter]SDW07033.1 nucleoside ABC transporter membrane protein [Arthrobacter sp. cf158]SEI73960.1 nucleoside ABC transporter membrane protein [Arthrobacter sp. yr096]
MTNNGQSSKDQTPDVPSAEVRAADVALDTAGGAMGPSIVPVSSQSGDPGHQEGNVLRRIVMGNGFVSVLAVIVALFLGGLLIASTDSQVAKTAGYFLARPGDFLQALWAAMTESYVALFQGAVFNAREGFKPLLETMTVATPLICAGLGVALAFRAGLFNIGAQGQIIISATLAAYVGFAWHLPFGLHLLVVIIMGVLGGAAWGAIVGILKARTGAHEVIVTIMLNYVALFLLDFLLNTAAFRRPGDNSPISPRLDETATYPVLIPGSRLHLGFLVAVALTFGVWWMLNRSTIGFEFRAVGANPVAARTAGVKVSRATILVMAFAGALAAFGGVAQVAGTEKVLTGGVAAQIGFDSITVALLGRSTPWGTFFAGLLFGAFRAGAVQMQIQTGTPIDIVLVVQSLIVLFIAAPPLIRSIFRLEPKKKNKTPKAAPKAALANASGGAK